MTPTVCYICVSPSFVVHVHIIKLVDPVELLDDSGIVGLHGVSTPSEKKCAHFQSRREAANSALLKVHASRESIGRPNLRVPAARVTWAIDRYYDHGFIDATPPWQTRARAAVP